MRLNTIPSAVTETFSIAGQTALLELPAGPFVQVAVLGGEITLSGNTLSGNFFFDQGIRDDDTAFTRVAVSDLEVDVDVAGDAATLQEGEGGFIATNAGVAGMISSTASTKDVIAVIQ